MNDDDLATSNDYAQYITDHCGGDRVICNGDTLLIAMEEGYLFEDFKQSLQK